MKKKILIGSIIAVAILVLVSFTGVVGYQTTSSTIAKASPLFSIRSKRAIGEESKDLTCRYVGKGNMLQFPKRDYKTVMTQKAIDRIRKMDDKSFEKFIESVIDSTQKDKRLYGVNPDIIREAFTLLRNSDTPIPILDDESGNKYPTVGDCVTFGYGIIGIYVCLILPLIIIREIISRFIGWCFEDAFASAFIICIGETSDCSITFGILT